MKILLLLSALSFSLFSQEKPKTISTPLANNVDACALNFPKLKSAFKQDPALYKGLTPVEQDLRLRTLRQGVVLNNGTEIRMIKSGCSHYIFLINIRPTEIKSMKAEYLFELAVLQLKLIPVEKDEAFNIKLITNALDKRNWPAIKLQSDIYSLPCGEALCTLRTIRDNGTPRDIEIIYDKIL
ncbi:MAG: hypothetical protein H7177_03620 [Rhizobacter sp.]|nr:hypothetical protein [Bacteriovorax sp.]